MSDLDNLPAGQRGAVVATLTHVAKALISRPASSIVALESRLRETVPAPAEPGDLSDDLLQELEMRNALRRFASWRAIEERCIPGAELQKQLGVSRRRLGQLRNEKKLLALRMATRTDLEPSLRYSVTAAW